MSLQFISVDVHEERNGKSSIKIIKKRRKKYKKAILKLVYVINSTEHEGGIHVLSASIVTQLLCRSHLAIYCINIIHTTFWSSDKTYALPYCCPV